MTLRVFAGLVVALAVGLLVYAVGQRLQRAAGPTVAGGAIEGFSGWLLALAIGQCLAALGLLGDLLRHLPMQGRLWDSGAPVAALGDFAGRVALAGFVLWATIAMLRRSRLYPRLLRLEMVVLVLRPVLAALLLVEDGDVFQTQPKLWIGFAVEFAVTGLLAAIGYLYAQHSLRVRNTFVR